MTRLFSICAGLLLACHGMARGEETDNWTASRLQNQKSSLFDDLKLPEMPSKKEEDDAKNSTDWKALAAISDVRRSMSALMISPASPLSALQWKELQQQINLARYQLEVNVDVASDDERYQGLKELAESLRRRMADAEFFGGIATTEVHCNFAYGEEELARDRHELIARVQELAQLSGAGIAQVETPKQLAELSSLISIHFGNHSQEFRLFADQKRQMESNLLAVATEYSSATTRHFDKEEYDLAAQNCRRCLAIQAELFGENSAAVADSYRTLGVTLFHGEQFEESQASINTSLRLFRNVGGELSYDYIECLHQKSELLTRTDQTAKAQKVLSEVFSLYETSIRRPSKLLVKMHLGSALLETKIGNGQYALEQLDKALSVCGQIQNNAEPDLLVTYRRVFSLLVQKKQWSKAERCRNMAMELAHRHFGPESRQTIMILCSYAKIYGQNASPRGIPILEQALQIEIAAGESEGDPFVWNLLQLLSENYRTYGDYAHAMIYANYCVEMADQCFGSSSRMGVVSRFQMSSVLEDVGATFPAYSLQRQVIEALHRDPDRDPSEVAYVLGSLTNLASQLMLHENAEAHLLELRQLTCHLPSDDPQTASQIDLLTSLVHYRQGKMEQARIEFEYLYCILQPTERRSDQICLLKGLTLTNWKLGNLDNAKRYAKVLLNLQAAQLEEGHPDLEETNNWIQEIQEEIDKRDHPPVDSVSPDDPRLDWDIYVEDLVGITFPYLPNGC